VVQLIAMHIGFTETLLILVRLTQE